MTRKHPTLPHIRSLDGVRGMAVLAVFCHHLLWLPSGQWPAAMRLASWAASYGFYGVDLFFVLSGYLITTLLLLQRKRAHYYSNFYWKRVFRILPPLLLILAMGWAWGPITPAAIALCLLFIANYSPLLHIAVNGPFWSLAVEEQFYLVWPFFLRRLRPAAVWRVLWIIVLVEPLLRLASAATEHGGSYYTFMRCDGLAWGAMLAISTYRYRVLRGRPHAANWWKLHGRKILAAGMLLGALNVARVSGGWLARFDAALGLSFLPLIFAGAMGYLLSHPRSAISRAVANPVLVFFGDISYMLYLTHAYLLDIYNHWERWPLHPSQTAYFARFWILLAVGSLVCAASLRWFERPVQKLRKHFVRRAA